MDTPIRLLHLTDTHLFATTDGCLLGQPTAATLDAVLALVREQDPNPSAWLLTGDLAHDGAPASYSALVKRLQDFAAPVYCVPGNHDDPSALAAWLDPGACAPARAVRLGEWALMLLDSTRPGEDGGTLGEAALAGLDALLQASPCRHALVALHHHPVPMESAWLDTMMVSDAADFFAILARYPQVRAVVWGHVHQAFAERRGSLALFATPSTCVQFRPRQRQFASDRMAPGYRWLILHPDGRIDSGLRRISQVQTPIAPEAIRA